MTNAPHNSGLKDNHRRGKVGKFLDARIDAGSLLSFVSAYFTLHAYHALRDALERAHSLRFLFGEPRFVSAMDRDDKESREFHLTESRLSLGNQLSQKKLAAELELPETYAAPGKAMQINRELLHIHDRLPLATAAWESAATELATLDRNGALP